MVEFYQWFSTVGNIHIRMEHGFQLVLFKGYYMKATGCRYKIVRVMILALLVSHIAWSQSSVHIQSEGSQLYNIQLEGTNYSSSEKGYLLIPQLAAGTHTLVMNFPGSTLPEYAFTCTVTAGVPRALSLKLSIENSWSLFDMVEFTVSRGTPATRAQIQLAARKPKDPSAKPVVNIRKIFDKPSTGGIDQVYIVKNGTKNDTIALFIPVLEEIKPKGTGSNYRPVPGQKMPEYTFTTVRTATPGRTTDYRLQTPNSF